MVLQTNLSLADCNTSLKACDNALNKAQVVISAQAKVVTDYEKKSKLDEAIKADQQSKLNSPLSDPIKVALGTTVVVILLELVTGHLK